MMSPLTQVCDSVRLPRGFRGTWEEQPEAAPPCMCVCRADPNQNQWNALTLVLSACPLDLPGVNVCYFLFVQINAACMIAQPTLPCISLP